MIVAILQARVTSSRLPGKVLADVQGKPMILRQIDRIRNAKKIDQLVVATSTDSSDDPLAKLCKENGIKCFRGSLNDVLDRFYQAAKTVAPTHVVRLTGDCPLIDAGIIDGIIELHLSGKFDYTSNAIERTFPDGLDVEVMTSAALERNWTEAKLPSEREHVTPYINRNPQLFNLGHYIGSPDLSAWRWTVDEPADLEVIRRIYAGMMSTKPNFTWLDVVDYVQAHPGLLELNSEFGINEGYTKSLREDAEFLARKNEVGASNV